MKTFLLTLILAFQANAQVSRTVDADRFKTTGTKAIVTLPTVSGTLSTLAGVETFTNKTVSGGAISNATISSSTIITSFFTGGTVSGTSHVAGTFSAPAITGGSVSGTTFTGTNINAGIVSGGTYNNPSLTGVATAPTQTLGDNSTRIATTAFVQASAAAPANAVTTTAVGGARLERVKFAGNAAATTSCTVSPCTIVLQSGSIASVTRASLGDYRVNFNAGTFSAVPVCVGRAHQPGGSGAVFVAQSGAATLLSDNLNSIRLITVVGGAVNDAAVDFICMGPR